ncbi:MAG: arabinosyltransferase domain-containing protein [Pseudonocardiaceae bacterium]
MFLRVQRWTLCVHGVAVATDIHRYVGPDRHWFDGQRYAALLGADSWGSAGKRLPVLLTLALW